MHPAAIAGFYSELEKLGALKPSIRLQAHQEGAVEQSHTSPGMILNWGLGSGKTIGSMAVAEEKGGNVLVVVPASLRENYKKQLRQAITPDRHKHYTVISYNSFRADPEGWVDKVRPTTLVTDEIHRLRNAAPREPFERVRSKIPFMLGLTGSLVNNDPEEIVPLVNLVAGKQVFKSTEDFDRRFVGETKVQPGLWARLRGARAGAHPHIQNEEALGSILRPFIHRFSGDTEYQKHVPKVTEKRVEVEMTPRQEDMLKSLQKSNPILDYKIRHNLPPSKSELKNLNAFMTGARQISNNPQAFSIQKTPSPKLEKMFQDLLESGLKDPNFKAVVYSNFLESGISPLIDQLHHQGVPAESFTGGLNDDQRKKIVDRFNKGHLRVLGLSPAGGEGLDLKGVKMVQLTEEHWNPERTRQAVGRSARFKSHDALPPEERRVQVNRYLAVHPEPGFFARLFGAKRPMSPDEWIDARRREKLDLNQSVVNAIPQFQRKAAGVNMMAAFSDELGKLAAGQEKSAVSGGTVWKALKSRILGSTLPIEEKLKRIKGIVGRNLPMHEIYPSRYVTRDAEGVKNIHLNSGGSRSTAKDLIEDVQNSVPKGKMAAAFQDELAKLAISGQAIATALSKRVMKYMPGLKRLLPGERAIVNSAMAKQHSLSMDAMTRPEMKSMVQMIQEHYPKARAKDKTFMERGMGLVSDKRMEELLPKFMKRLGPEGVEEYAAASDSVGKAMHRVNLENNQIITKNLRKHGSMAAAFSGELSKEAITHGKVIRAIFQRAYQGKQVTPTIHRMADTFSSTAERMGSPVTREGLKKWIAQVKDTGKI